MSLKTVIKKKTPKGTISKAPSRSFSKKDLEQVWQKHNLILKELEQPALRYTRHVSDLIKDLRDVSEQLITAGAIPNLTKKDTASYVWKQLSDRNIPYHKGHFYDYFLEEQKHSWQTSESLSKKQNTNHEHIFDLVGNFDGLGEVKRCGGSGDFICGVMMIDGKIFEAIPQDLPEPELKPTKPKANFEEINEPRITAYREAGKALLSAAEFYEHNCPMNELSKKNQLIEKDELHLVRAATKFLNNAFDNKTKVPEDTQHLLVEAYAEATQSHAGGVYIMKHKDYGAKRYGLSVKILKKLDQLSRLLSGKQTGKIMSGKTPNLHPRYEPKNEKQAKDRQYYGIKCAECGCWRVDYDRVANPNYNEETDPVHEKHLTKLICFRCGKVQEEKTFPLPLAIPPKVKVDWESN